MKKRLAGLAAAMVALGVASAAMADTTNYKYDDLGRLVEVDYPDGSRVAYAYDAAGNRVSVTRTAATAGVWGTMTWGQDKWG